MKSVNCKTTYFGHSFFSFASDIKISHSVFALPFAASAIFLFDLPLPNLQKAVWLVVAMVGGRSFAMGFNRLVDRTSDARNPRTLNRAIPAGRLSPRAALGWTIVASGMLVYAAFSLNPLAGFCSLPLLLILAAYSYLKKFSWACHWYLGMCLGLAPVAVCVALTGSAPLGVLVLGVAIMFWTAGFDILYALQDEDFDRAHNLKSVPSRFGKARSILVSQICFAAMIGALLIVGQMTFGGWMYYGGVATIAGFLAYEHYLIRDIKRTGSLAKLDKAFFNQNAFVSLFYLCAVVLDWVVF